VKEVPIKSKKKQKTTIKYVYISIILINPTKNFLFVLIILFALANISLKTSKKFSRKNVAFFTSGKHQNLYDERSICLIQNFFRTKIAKLRGYQSVEAKSAAALSMINVAKRQVLPSFQRLNRKMSFGEEMGLGLGRVFCEQNLHKRRNSERVGRLEEEEEIFIEKGNWEKFLRRKKRKQYLEVKSRSMRKERRPDKGGKWEEEKGEEEDEWEEGGKKRLGIGMLALISNYNQKVKKKKDEMREERTDFMYLEFSFGHFFYGKKYRFKVRFHSFTPNGNTTQVTHLLVVLYKLLTKKD
jgi:hypothetical protein